MHGALPHFTQDTAPARRAADPVAQIRRGVRVVEWTVPDRQRYG
ncbi:hypothetical protein [Streptomyces clavuligerus]|uniref:Uncharacterized protein n=1 Tax=Streptomyces clavuligerus TaxID=1901 RepID=B5GLZ0_STRCL|nr:hypothetical protein [Streptomyces clavuligerus]EDY47336.1 hypothetical protein SSCG_00364 [Streptomyces clavuligerus]EFG04995.1 Hypothetical protein SCLAV_p1514 [Streptomyces clavuligerus]